MHSCRVAPRIFFDCGEAQLVRRSLSRFGPTVPVVPAAASVWQLPQPPTPVNTALPAAGVVPVTAAGRRQRARVDARLGRDAPT